MIASPKVATYDLQPKMSAQGVADKLCERIKIQIPAFVYLEAPVGEDPDKRDYIVSNSRIEATGYMPAHGLDEGISELIKGFHMIRDRAYGNI